MEDKSQDEVLLDVSHQTEKNKVHFATTAIINRSAVTISIQFVRSREVIIMPRPRDDLDWTRSEPYFYVEFGSTQGHRTMSFSVCNTVSESRRSS
ncbi:hypothetical protein N7481_010310 [Penicillium waksmanii]|uniref:uncharacterized protein n=1 Tax=Penicillium waksmanii TaxID=69791 RepID=UPI002548D848|nr:uncharacterized protein N7481_010310 [Penicillium waksmanii]KAJ5976603.1 hypothetical protein N7481_010310 [Penicillium waksmanii]